MNTLEMLERMKRLERVERMKRLRVQNVLKGGRIFWGRKLGWGVYIVLFLVLVEPSRSFKSSMEIRKKSKK